MADILIAKEILDKEDYTLVVVKDEKVIYKSKEKGIIPMYTLSMKMKDVAYNASIADKIIGKGAALLYNHLNIKEVYGNLISTTSIKVLDEGKINYTYDKLCENIMNRDYSDYCPIEKLSMDIENGEEFLNKLHIFLGKNLR